MIHIEHAVMAGYHYSAPVAQPNAPPPMLPVKKLDKYIISTSRKALSFLVRWAGKSPHFDRWMPWNALRCNVRLQVDLQRLIPREFQEPRDRRNRGRPRG
jgi:hypothetical protein